MNLSQRVWARDGGYGTQMTLHVGDPIDGDPLWCDRFNFTNPEAVIQTHLDFLESGAEMIFTNTYQASIEGYMKYLKLSEEESLELMKTAVRLAHTARERYQKQLKQTKEEVQNSEPFIIAAIGPYGAHLHDASEYTGAYVEKVSAKTMTDWHRVRIDACLDVGIDALGLVTIPSILEAKPLVEMLCDDYPNVKFWLAFQCKDATHTAHNEKFSEVAQKIWNLLKERNAQQNCLAIGVNCVQPKFVTSLMKSVNGDREVSDRIPLLAFPNSGEVYDDKDGWTGNCVKIANYVPEWAQLGVKIIGGGCRTYAKDVKEIVKAIHSYNKEHKLN